MKLSNIVSETEFARLQELDAPMLGATPAPAAGATTMAPGQQVAADPQAQAKMQAQQALDRANQKKQIQDAISQKQKELQDLQKQLAQIK
jgi:phage-related minor tail protein